jgi:two-component system invasion response regulator UvrY
MSICGPLATSDRAQPLGVVVAAPSPVIRGGLIHVLTTLPGLTVRYSVDGLTALPPGVSDVALVVLDLAGNQAARIGVDFWAKLPAGSRAIVLCRPEDPPNLVSALRGGVHALLTREFEVDELAKAVTAARHGGLHVAAELFTPLIDRTAAAPAENQQDLARREVETLKWIAEGLTHGQISRRMGLTEATVSTYVKRIRNKLNAGNKAELTRRAIELGYVSPR